MTLAINLSKVVPGFADPVTDSQRIFRNSLQALSHPGEVIALIANAAIPDKAQPSAALLLLALLDADTRLWLSPSIASSDAAHWIVFHTNCKLVDSPAESDFAWIHSIEEMPELSSFKQGTDEYPEQSTTCLLNIAGFDHSDNALTTITLQGPGIFETNQLRLQSFPSSHLQKLINQWHANNLLFPKGVDVILCAKDQISGLPRTTKLSLSETSDCAKG